MLAELCLAVAVYMEARGEPLAGQYAVAEVVMNRVESKRFPNDVCSVVSQKHQFSFLWDGKQFPGIRNKKAWERAETVARYTLRHKPQYTGACHYTRKNIRRVWMKDLTRVAVIGNHKFMQGGCN